VIDYVPGKWLVESKSLKLYFPILPQSRPIFDEACTVASATGSSKPSRRNGCAISGYWYPLAGGMPIDVFFPERLNCRWCLCAAKTGVAPYRGRGLKTPSVIPAKAGIQAVLPIVETKQFLQAGFLQIVPLDSGFSPE